MRHRSKMSGASVVAALSMQSSEDTDVVFDVEIKHYACIEQSDQVPHLSNKDVRALIKRFKALNLDGIADLTNLLWEQRKKHGYGRILFMRHGSYFSPERCIVIGDPDALYDGLAWLEFKAGLIEQDLTTDDVFVDGLMPQVLQLIGKRQISSVAA